MLALPDVHHSARCLHRHRAPTERCEPESRTSASTVPASELPRRLTERAVAGPRRRRAAWRKGIVSHAVSPERHLRLTFRLGDERIAQPAVSIGTCRQRQVRSVQYPRS